MRFFSEPIGLPEGIFIILRDLIRERLGLHYETSKLELLADKLYPRVVERGCDSFLDYYYLLKYNPIGDEEWRYLSDALAVPETFFWREIDCVQALVNVLLPQYLANAKFANNVVRIWSAACSTGEEPLTIAIALNEGGWFDKLPIEIYASDASQSAITKAKQGIYRERSFRNLPPLIKAKYFHPVEEGWQVIPTLHTRIRWITANLMAKSEVEPLTHAHFIFCRNVFIYFAESAIRQTAQLFFEGMPSPGYLFLGTAESLLKLSTQFELQEIEGAFAYVKERNF